MTSTKRKQNRERDLMELLRITYILLVPGVQDIAGFETIKVSKVYDLIKRAEAEGFVKEFRAGQTLEMQKRIALTNKGIHTVCQHFSLPLKEQLCQGSHVENFNRLRLYEPLMRLAPRLFRSGAIDIPFSFPRDPGDDPRVVVLDEATKLVDIDWFESTQESNVHAHAWYRTAAGYMFWVPIVTVGLHHISARREEEERKLPPESRIDLTAGQESVPAFIHGPGPARPIGALFIVHDRLAAWFVERHYPGLTKAIVDAEGNVIRALYPQIPRGRVYRPPPYQGLVGIPEEELDRLLKSSAVKAMQGVPQRKVFEWVNGIQGINIRRIAKGIRHPDKEVKNIVDKYVEAELMMLLDGGIYLSPAGRVAAAKRDRQHANLVHGLFSYLTAKDPAGRLHDREHELAVSVVGERFGKEGIQAYPGWRFVINYPREGGTQLRPDLWVLLPLGDGTAMWVAVEVERSATGDAAIDRKCRPHRIARDRGETWPVLVVAGKGVPSAKGRQDDLDAARRFAARGSDLPLLAIPFHQAAEGRMTGPEPAWLRGGETVPMSHIASMVRRDYLIQRLGDRAW